MWIWTFLLFHDTNLSRSKRSLEWSGCKAQEIHQYGADIIKALFAERYDEARSLYREAESYSNDLIRDLENAKQRVMG